MQLLPEAKGSNKVPLLFRALSEHTVLEKWVKISGVGELVTLCWAFFGDPVLGS